MVVAQVLLKPQARSLLYNFHTKANTTVQGLSFFDASPSAAAVGGAAAYPWPEPVRIYRNGSRDGDFVTPCLGSLRGDATGASCWDQAGELSSRWRSVCGESCDTFGPVIGTAATTHVSGVQFPWGAPPSPLRLRTGTDTGTETTAASLPDRGARVR